MRIEGKLGTFSDIDEAAESPNVGQQIAASYVKAAYSMIEAGADPKDVMMGLLSGILNVAFYHGCPADQLRRVFQDQVDNVDELYAQLRLSNMEVGGHA